ncbi:hypothetical protein ONS95_003440 [Cadophora gregata]|uniref:uncharacterized protein n=1 Tax=Cadophora gregata TaxID=51156 RepID=UPI0026DCA35B|nr:uncharacterized protein ONS95_003440 [Cadophora gregata]KAK0108647.1 hypothetical protein ONS95_003440 [Cadophora gregata]KAK0108762.1 hypothetical protein ONS96_002607 [Cadophora gregata f. sp. sojae]
MVAMARTGVMSVPSHGFAVQTKEWDSILHMNNSVDPKPLHTRSPSPNVTITHTHYTMETHITIEGSPAEQARILKVLKRCGLINQYNEITPTRADAFDAFNKNQEMLITTLEAQCQEKNALITKIGQESTVHGEKRRDAEIENRRLEKSNVAKSIVINTL